MRVALVAVSTIGCGEPPADVTSSGQGGAGATTTDRPGSTTSSSGDQTTREGGTGDGATTRGLETSSSGEASGSSTGSQPVSWERFLGGSDYDNALEIRLVEGERYLVVGHTRSTDIPGLRNAGSYDLYAALLDAEGTEIWETTGGGPLTDATFDVVASPEGGWVVAGIVGSGIGRDGQLVALNEDGAFGRPFVAAGSASDWLVGVVATDVGNLVVGWTESPSFLGTRSLGDYDIVAADLDATGTPAWARRYGGTGLDSAIGVVAVADGFVIAGRVGPGTVGVKELGFGDIYVLKIDPQGEPVWHRTLGGSGHDSPSALAATPDGEILVVGRTQSTDIPGQTNAGWTDYYIALLDGAGELIWERVYGGEFLDDPGGVQPTDDGGAIVAAHSYSAEILGVAGDPLGAGVLLKLDAAGDLEWLRTYGTPSEDVLASVRQVEDGGYIAAGFASPNGRSDVWVIRTTPDGTIER